MSGLTERIRTWGLVLTMFSGLKGKKSSTQPFFKFWLRKCCMNVCFKDEKSVWKKSKTYYNNFHVEADFEPAFTENKHQMRGLESLFRKHLFLSCSKTFRRPWLHNLHRFIGLKSSKASWTCAKVLFLVSGRQKNTTSVAKIQKRPLTRNNPE